MGLLSLALTGVSSNWLVPQQLIEVAMAQGAVLGAPGTPRILLMGVKTSTGTATPDTQVYGPLSVERDVVTYFGAGSPVHLQWLAVTAICKTALIYGIAVTESAGVAASDTVTITGAAGAPGTLTYAVCGKTFSINVQKNDSANTIAGALKDAINNAKYLPVTATAPANVVTVAYRTKGTNGNLVRHRATITSGITTSVAVANPTLTLGATDEDYTTALATIASDRYDYIVPAINPTGTSDTRFAALSAQVQTQALPTTGIRQQVIVCTPAVLSDATTFLNTYNKYTNQIAWQKNSEFEPLSVAANLAGVRYLRETGADPGVSYDNYGTLPADIWNVPCQYSQADFPSPVDINAALSVGLTPIAAQRGGTGKSYVVMSCTAQGADPRIRDTSKVTVTYRFADDLAARDASIYPRAKVADDPVAGAKPAAPEICTPQREKASVIVPLLISYRDAGLLTDVDGPTGSIASTAVGIDPVVSTRINARIPIKVTPLRHQFAALVSEVSAG